jgi:hypothetical protein
MKKLKEIQEKRFKQLRKKSPDDEITEKILYPLDQRIEYIAQHSNHKEQLLAIAKEVKELLKLLNEKD